MEELRDDFKGLFFTYGFWLNKDSQVEAVRAKGERSAASFNSSKLYFY